MQFRVIHNACISVKYWNCQSCHAVCSLCNACTYNFHVHFDFLRLIIVIFVNKFLTFGPGFCQFSQKLSEFCKPSTGFCSGWPDVTVFYQMFHSTDRLMYKLTKIIKKELCCFTWHCLIFNNAKFRGKLKYSRYFSANRILWFIAAYCKFHSLSRHIFLYILHILIHYTTYIQYYYILMHYKIIRVEILYDSSKPRPYQFYNTHSSQFVSPEVVDTLTSR